MRAIILFLTGLLALTTAFNDKRRVCYHLGWTATRNGTSRFDINSLPEKSCTHLIYASAGLNPYNGEIIAANENSVAVTDEETPIGYQKLKNLVLRDSRLKTMISLGGDAVDGSTISMVLREPTLRFNLVKSIVKFLVKYEFNGFDLNWKYPKSLEDKRNLVLFLKELKKQFEPKGWVLSITAHMSANQYYDYDGVSKHVDFINMMLFNFNGPWMGTTGPSAPLDSTNNINVHVFVQNWMDNHVPNEKIVMGISSIGVVSTLLNPSDNKMNAMVAESGRPGPYNNLRGLLGYFEFCKEMSQWTVIYDEMHRMPYAYKGDQWMSFENKQSISEKVNYVMEKDLGGIAIWTVDNDDFNGVCGEKWPLLNTINKALSTQSGSFAYRKNSVSDYSQGNFLPENPDQYRSRRSVQNSRAADSSQQNFSPSFNKQMLVNSHQARGYPMY
ncbi:chitinase-3-like protein 1 isoform X2 [Copidosoma floridanum]|uniref:chitinase-3-like protein 1 isoform X2 n=1 Tax=Copidosoma floridanum TaxID=29053 RepID=UPI0006C952EE|nr:chitinase-3-like protein 1 isoform X2 [Copidosoma floridanum]